MWLCVCGACDLPDAIETETHKAAIVAAFNIMFYQLFNVILIHTDYAESDKCRCRKLSFRISERKDTIKHKKYIYLFLLKGYVGYG